MKTRLTSKGWKKLAAELQKLHGVDGKKELQTIIDYNIKFNSNHGKDKKFNEQEKMPFDVIDGPEELILHNIIGGTNCYFSGFSLDTASKKLIPKWNIYRYNAVVFKNYDQAFEIASKWKLEIEKLRYKV